MTAPALDLDAALCFTREAGWHLQPGPDLEQLVDDAQVRRMPACSQHACGRERHTAGRPRAGWIKVQQTGTDGIWFCSWRCVQRGASHQART